MSLGGRKGRKAVFARQEGKVGRWAGGSRAGRQAGAQRVLQQPVEPVSFPGFSSMQKESTKWQMRHGRQKRQQSAAVFVLFGVEEVARKCKSKCVCVVRRCGGRYSSSRYVEKRMRAVRGGVW